MTALTDRVRAHPVATFLAVAFPVGWALLAVPPVARAVSGAELPSEPFILGTNLLGLLLPALVITRIADGREGLRELGRRMIAVRVAPRWWAAALLALPVVALLLAVAWLGAPDGERLGGALVGGFAVPVVTLFLLINLWEESAWTGLVQARLAQRWGPLLGALATAPLFALLHLPLQFVPGANPWANLGVLLLVAVPFRVFAGWLYERTGSLFLVGLFHAVFNAVNGTDFLPVLYPGTRADLIPLVALWLLGLAATAGLARRGAREVQPVSAR